MRCDTVILRMRRRHFHYVLWVDALCMCICVYMCDACNEVYCIIDEIPLQWYEIWKCWTKDKIVHVLNVEGPDPGSGLGPGPKSRFVFGTAQVKWDYLWTLCLGTHNPFISLGNILETYRKRLTRGNSITLPAKLETNTATLLLMGEGQH